MKKTIIMAMALIISCLAVHGQISTFEKPVSFCRGVPGLSKNAETQKIMPKFDMSMVERDERNINGSRFGYEFYADFNFIGRAWI